MVARRQPVLGNLNADELLYADTSTVQSVSYSDAEQTALAAFTLRKGAMFENDADKICYLKLGVDASPTSYSKALHPKDSIGIGGFFNLSDAQRTYTGIINVIWAAGGSGALRITELS